MSSIHPFVAVLFSFAIHAANSAAAPPCKTFHEIYLTGKELCEKMYNGAFVYEPDEAKAYTMWFFDNKNPNDATAKSLGKLAAGGHDTCHLSYFHKDKPGVEPDSFTECHPWKKNACCAHKTVMNVTTIKEGYGKEYHWDRCGPISPECERFFVQESCFYECDPNAGLYRKFHSSEKTKTAVSTLHDKSNKDHNEWQMLGMPIKKSYCDAWHTACRNDKFCASNSGDFFSCAAEYKKVDESAALKTQLAAAEEKARVAKSDSDGWDTGVIIGFISAGVLIFALLVCGCCLIMKEKSGKPIFYQAMKDNPGTSGGQAIGSSA